MSTVGACASHTHKTTFINIFSMSSIHANFLYEWNIPKASTLHNPYITFRKLCVPEEHPNLLVDCCLRASKFGPRVLPTIQKVACPVGIATILHKMPKSSILGLKRHHGNSALETKIYWELEGNYNPLQVVHTTLIGL